MITNSNNFDLDTIQFLLRLRTLNEYWYEWLLISAKSNPKHARRVINEACKTLKYSMLTPDKVNVFQICRGVNTGELESESFRLVSNKEWQAHLNKIIAKIKIEKVIQKDI